MPERQIIAVTGTPGVGKSSFARELAKKLNAKLLDLNEVIEESKIYSSDENGTKVTATEDLREEFKQVISGESQDIVVDGLLSHLLAPNQVTHVVVLRTNPEVLRERLSSREYHNEKLEDNLEAEALGVILSEAIGIHGVEKIYEIDTTDKPTSESVKLFEKALKDELPLEPGDIDWLEEFF
ncbi:hypothetical protein AKJ44_01420 [candidate division MSBL1 archaeon SCGC-AAA261F17]|uniref:Putative adenylate kinase n=1 Tax=candidate division MSBL1 archaeon SCGC-AAA261F17 TaxID=1698274 RepID=A0A133V6M5_9EURY|nr:hypothetical protein AKJ44_01420 [candidate division MSBL1 archaeon SCGC-AAA261F17]